MKTEDAPDCRLLVGELCMNLYGECWNARRHSRKKHRARSFSIEPGSHAASPLGLCCRIRHKGVSQRREPLLSWGDKPHCGLWKYSYRTRASPPSERKASPLWFK